uniref:Glutamine amidotransferase type-2 domain-containing protein n=1 Tax=Neogobius melanostomus TaxID=47308 RepID=A0A8C6UPV2_9GOBI
MCGIFCQLSASPAPSEPGKAVHGQLQKRGPNCSQNLTIRGADFSYTCLFSAHVLHMRGALTPQPIQDTHGNVLLWNGEVFGGLSVSPNENDTAVISKRLASCDSPSEILHVFSSIQGPWAFIYHQKDGDYLWFGRDFFGRRSLLWRFDRDAEIFTLSSVAARSLGDCAWKEVPAVGLYRVALKTIGESISFEVFQWDKVGVGEDDELRWETVHDDCIAITNQSRLVMPSPVAALNMCVPNASEEKLSESSNHLNGKDLEQLLASYEQTSEVHSLIDVLSEAVRRRVQSLPFVQETESPATKTKLMLLYCFLAV